jgi:hypothetical protein
MFTNCFLTKINKAKITEGMDIHFCAMKLEVAVLIRAVMLAFKGRRLWRWFYCSKRKMNAKIDDN